MSGSSRSKGIVADGEKIKALRRKAGHTQKGLIRGTGIELRTYQRAEQGHSILPEILQQIAVILNVDIHQIRKEAEGDKDPANTFRLYCASHVGASKLFRELQHGNERVRYDLQIDPSREVAEKVATLIESCQELEVKSSSKGRTLQPAEKVRAIGALNDLVGEVHRLGVSIYFGTYFEFESVKCDRTVLDPSLTGGDVIRPYTTSLSRQLRIVLSHETTPTITKPLASWSTKDAATKRAIKKNLEMRIRPEWLENDPGFMFLNDDFAEAYRAAFTEQLSALLIAENAVPEQHAGAQDGKLEGEVHLGQTSM